MDYLVTQIKNRIRDVSRREGEKEACGLILEANSNLWAWKCKNTAADPTASFHIPHSKIKWARDRGWLKAIWHSHPQPCEKGLSELDKLIAEKLRVDAVAYDVERDEFLVHKPTGYEIPYKGRPFVPGIFDCWALTRDWYQREKNITLEDFTHKIRDVGNDTAFWRVVVELDGGNETNEFKNRLEKSGFFVVGINERKSGDICLMNFQNIKSAIHTAVCLSKYRILHHPADGESLEEPYSDYWLNLTVNIMRYGR